MPYLFNTPEDQQAMLQAIGVESIDALFAPIPAEFRLSRPLDLPPALTELELTRHMTALGGAKRPRGAEGLLPGRRQLRPLRARRGGRDRLARRILHVLHAVPAGGEPRQLAGDVRIPDADLPADGHGRVQRQPVRRRHGGGRSGVDGHERHAPRGQSRRRGRRASRVPPDSADVSGRSERGVRHGWPPDGDDRPGGAWPPPWTTRRPAC